MMRWTVRLEARTDRGEVKTTELVTFDRPVVDGTLAELGLALSEAKAVQAELGARTAFREAARILEALLPASPANHESVRTRTHAVALRLEAADRQAAAAVAVGTRPRRRRA